MSRASIRRARKRPGVGWKRATTGIPRPDPADLRTKTRATG